MVALVAQHRGATLLLTMLCQTCKQNPATVHVTEIVHTLNAGSASSAASPNPAAADPALAGASAGNAPSKPSANPAALKIQEQHLCEACAQAAKLPHLPVKGVAEILKLLQASAQRSKREVGIECPECGMSLMEFRQKGRLGCPKDYEVFGAQLRDLLERIHGANRHVGRVPGLDQASMVRLERVNELQSALESAIRDEAYEAAARLRDELKSLQQP